MDETSFIPLALSLPQSISGVLNLVCCYWLWRVDRRLVQVETMLQMFTEGKSYHVGD
jgi:hypothetical protein